jgi:hypothetical protein
MKFHTFLRIFRSFPIFLYGESYNLASFRFKLHIFVRYIIQMGRFSSPNQVFCMKYHTLQSGETVNVTGTVRIPDTPGWRSIDMTGLGYEPPYTPGWRSINVTGSVRTSIHSRLEVCRHDRLGTNRLTLQAGKVNRRAARYEPPYTPGWRSIDVQLGTNRLTLQARKVNRRAARYELQKTLPQQHLAV